MPPSPARKGEKLKLISMVVAKLPAAKPLLHLKVKKLLVLVIKLNIGMELKPLLNPANPVC
jgi:hypothetical protein